MICIVCMFLSVTTYSLSGPEKSTDFGNSLDTKKIKAVYDNGDYRSAVVILEETIRSHREYGLLDSIFIARNLAVLYSLDPRTREKGRYYMFRLLGWLPSDKLEDMRVPEEIRAELEHMRAQYIAIGDSSCDVFEVKEKVGSWAVGGTENPIRGAAMSRDDSTHSRPTGRSLLAGRKTYWFIGGAGILGAGALVGALVWVRSVQSPEPQVKTLIVGEGNGG